MSERPATLLFPSHVKTNVLDQHAALRGLFDQALAETTACLRHEVPPNLSGLAGIARELDRTFSAHLDFEERALAPILAVVDSWGPERVEALLDEHARQRCELDTIVAGISGGWDCERLAVTLRSLVADLLIDMDDEEQGCLRSAILAQDVVSADSVWR